MNHPVPRDPFEERLADQLRRCEPRLGLFGPDSMTWRVYRERALILGGPRALMLQLAHPAVAKGVVDHSRFEDDALGRGQRTFDVVNAIAFGSVDEALKAARRMRRRHDSVAGRLDTGEAYDARDPALLMWVAATLIDSAIWSYDRLVAPLSESLREQLYAEQRRWFWAYGLDPDTTPRTYRDFRHYMVRMLRGPTLSATPAARAVMDALLAQEPSAFLSTVLAISPGILLRLLDRDPARRLSLRVLVTWAGALAPERLREGFGLSWGLEEKAIWAATVRGVRTLVPTLPPVARYHPAYLEALRRVSGRGSERLETGRAEKGLSDR